MSKRVANKDARRCVQNREPFVGSNTYSVSFVASDMSAPRYAVYSYGRHWPLFIYEEGKWYENADKYSPTTSRHRSQLHPLCETEERSAEDMRDIAEIGVAWWMRRKLAA
mgnify:CR=1 FL=1